MCSPDYDIRSPATRPGVGVRLGFQKLENVTFIFTFISALQIFSLKDLQTSKVYPQQVTSELADDGRLAYVQFLFIRKGNSDMISFIIDFLAVQRSLSWFCCPVLALQLCTAGLKHL